MADYTCWKEVTARQVYCLDAPTNAAEVCKMISGAYKGFASVHGRDPYDNEVEVTVRDGGSRDGGQVIVTFTMETEDKP